MIIPMKVAATVVAGSIGWGVASGVVVADATDVGPTGARGPAGPPGATSTVAGPAGIRGVKGPTGNAGPKGADYHASWAVVDASDLRSNWTGSCYVSPDTCLFSESFFGGTLVVRNTGTQPQPVRFKIEMYYKPNGTVGCSKDIDQDAGDRKIAYGDDREIPGEDLSVPVFVKPGRTEKIFIDMGSGCLSQDETLHWTARIRPPDSEDLGY